MNSYPPLGTNQQPGDSLSEADLRRLYEAGQTTGAKGLAMLPAFQKESWQTLGSILNPDEPTAARLKMILAKLSPREREALNRFYVQGQDGIQIARAMGMDESELQKLKSRVKEQYRAIRRSE